MVVCQDVLLAVLSRRRVKMAPCQGDVFWSRLRANTTSCQNGAVPKQRRVRMAPCQDDIVPKRHRVQTMPSQNYIVTARFRVKATPCQYDVIPKAVSCQYETDSRRCNDKTTSYQKMMSCQKGVVPTRLRVTATSGRNECVPTQHHSKVSY